jgi:diguanylate cyclase (GGDEF)-like protein
MATITTRIQSSGRRLADPLTGLCNRGRFEEELERAVADSSRHGTAGAVLMIDLDGFREVNETMGHSFGNRLLSKVGRVLKATLRETDVVARLGGDEFAAILAGAGEEGALFVADAILRALQRDAVVLEGGRHDCVTGSIGITTFTSDLGLTAEELIVEADLAMHEAKEAGKNRARLFSRSGDDSAGAVDRGSWLQRLTSGIEEGRFELFAQPVRGICATDVDRFELLLRLRDEHGELIPPSTFVYVAERFNLIQQIDRWVFQQAVSLLRRHHENGNDISLSINMSGKTLCDPDILSDIETLLTATPVPPGRLIVEVTETAAIVNIKAARAAAQGLHRLGCRLALDDFGSGFASFYYLKHLKFDYLKIDGEFVKALCANHTDQLVVQSVVDIARGLGAETIAEFVGDSSSVVRLRELGVDYGQGYHLGRPAPVGDLLPALAA